MTVIDNISSKNAEDSTGEYQRISKLSKERLAIYTVFRVTAAVTSSGFSQLYSNSSGKFAEDAESAFGMIGAPKFQRLMARANKIYRDTFQKKTAAISKPKVSVR
ncbi:MAG: hypothetical protein CVV64_20285 [Candidatus Wallbacteria bacterium HGW-Wallbacteria-1]|jgi:hypothetical protein|uniref:DNA mimic protein DMP19 C-terminal domain-containing protein n=1 Tax=Candidatus Wallbacteria bacterium HGW-Wallbacteria-1 TaxID=2013854 RepID=A0A2N1PIJ1_9BACT|nr:MAG: hypothetical protein CVV64_20285 [Candidatus Wallbacteria bacterium HGW-Wallbacteria-1]